MWDGSQQNSVWAATSANGSNACLRQQLLRSCWCTRLSFGIVKQELFESRPSHCRDIFDMLRVLGFGGALVLGKSDKMHETRNTGNWLVKLQNSQKGPVSCLNGFLSCQKDGSCSCNETCHCMIPLGGKNRQLAGKILVISINSDMSTEKHNKKRFLQCFNKASFSTVLQAHESNWQEDDHPALWGN